jgi:hypothetical protein
MKITHRTCVAAAMAVALAFVPAMDASARGGFRGGGFRSSSAIRSFGGARSSGSLRSITGWGSATRPAAKAKSAPSASTGSSPFSFTRKSISGSRSSVSAQRGLYDSAKKSGTLFSSKTEASQAFKSRYAKDYGSSFASEPASRPSYIPSSAYVGGQNVNIVYNQGLGGYGYMHPTLGTWMLFDALGDAAMLDAAMSNRGYYWGGAPAYISHGQSYLGFAFAMLVVLIMAAIIVNAVMRRRTARWEEERSRGRGRY